MEKRLLKIGAAAAVLGTTPGQLRKWEQSGELLPTRKTKGGTRYYAVSDLLGVTNESAPTICYARVSSHDQKADLDRQHARVGSLLCGKGLAVGSHPRPRLRMNYRKKGLQRLLDLILRRQMKRLVLTHKDRLLRFGAELVFALCERQGIEIVMIHQGEQPNFEEELAQDVLEIITVFSARLYGARSHKHKRVMETLKEAVT